LDAEHSLKTHTHIGAAHAVEAWRKRRSRCGRCTSVRPAVQHNTAYTWLVRPRVPGAFKVTPLNPQTVAHYILRKHLPAKTLIVNNSALEPLLAVGIGVPEPQSPGEHVWSPGRPCSAPLLTQLPTTRSSQAATSTACMRCHSHDSPPQAPLTVYTVQELRTSAALQPLSRSKIGRVKIYVYRPTGSTERCATEGPTNVPPHTTLGQTTSAQST
jgi:hypothetical protein